MFKEGDMIGKTILIVDDNRDIIRTIAEELKTHNHNFTVINANNGLNGVRVAREELPDLILMDWDMPIMNGLEAIRTLKNDANPRDHGHRQNDHSGGLADRFGSRSCGLCA
jgi:CheY-like chemotaxis protein